MESNESTNPRYLLFEKYKSDCEAFVETGTHIGDGVQTALEVGYKKIYSVELGQQRADHCRKRFEDHKNVFIARGFSTGFLRALMPNINERCLFWLDAHAEGGGAPTLEELDIIGQHHIKDHVILVDDVPVYYGDGKRLMDKILTISNDYKFYWEQTREGYDDYVLIAATGDIL